MGLVTAITAAATIGGAALSASSSKKATKKAVDAQTASNAENNALQREIYAKNESYLAPYAGSGIQPGNAIMALLGYGAPEGQAQSQAQPTQTFQSQQAPQELERRPYPGTEFGYREDFTAPSGELMPLREGSTPLYGFGYTQAGVAPQFGQPQQQFAPQQQSGITAPTAQQAFDTYRNSTGYNFRMNEGLKALTSNFRGRGMGQSGAAIKSALGYSQGLASDEFGNYLAQLSNQQRIGLGGASALAGVGQSFADATSANNRSSADAISNAALVNGANRAGVFSTAAGALGRVVGGELGSSFQPNRYGITG